jgi:hypothetical protein
MRVRGSYIFVIVCATYFASVATAISQPENQKGAFGIVSGTEKDFAMFDSYGCAKLSNHAISDETFTILNCKNNVDASVSAAGSGLKVQPVETYSKLGFGDSMGIAIDAFVDPSKSVKTDVGLYFPAIGSNPTEKNAWLATAMETLKAKGLDSKVAFPKGDDSFAVVPVIPGQQVAGVWTSVSGDIGLAISSDAAAKATDLSSFGLTNGVKIFTTDKLGTSWN